MEHAFGAASFRDVSAPHRHLRARGRRPRPKALAVALAAAAAGLLIAGGVAYGGSSTAPQRVVVKSGDTLWGIAQARYTGDDIQSRVAQIESDNHLRSAALTPGQVLQLPAP
jgi:nucleoid-associated protein YgaU